MLSTTGRYTVGESNLTKILINKIARNLKSMHIKSLFSILGMKKIYCFFEKNLLENPKGFLHLVVNF